MKILIFHKRISVSLWPLMSWDIAQLHSLLALFPSSQHPVEDKTNSFSSIELRLIVSKHADKGRHKTEKNWPRIKTQLPFPPTRLNERPVYVLAWIIKKLNEFNSFESILECKSSLKFQPHLVGSILFCYLSQAVDSSVFTPSGSYDDENRGGMYVCRYFWCRNAMVAKCLPALRRVCQPTHSYSIVLLSTFEAHFGREKTASRVDDWIYDQRNPECYFWIQPEHVFTQW